jgi:hypothetical protein
MSRRLRAADITDHLDDAGHERSAWIDGDWDPGHRTAQNGPRIVHVFHDGPGEAHHLDLYAQALRRAELHVVPEQQDHNGRRRLVVTKP